MISDSSDRDCEEVDYDRAISLTGKFQALIKMLLNFNNFLVLGYGKFHYLFLLVCGWANASDAVEILCISFLLPAAECDLRLTSADKGWLSAVTFLGMLIGGYVWGSLSDSFGRKLILMTAMYVNASCGILSSLSQDKFTFIGMRFLSGLG